MTDPITPGRAYRVALIACLAWVVLFPTWTGRVYLRQSGDGQWQRGGGVLMGGGFSVKALLWAPPEPVSVDSWAVRWPGRPVRPTDQGPYYANVVEIDFTATAVRLAGWVTLLSLGCGVWHRVRGGGPDRLLHVGWWVGITSAVALIAVFVLVAVSMGYAPGDYAVGMLAVGAAIGVVIGLTKRERPESASGPRRNDRGLAGLAFLAGAIVACVLAVLSVSVGAYAGGVLRDGSSPFAGPTETSKVVAASLLLAHGGGCLAAAIRFGRWRSFAWGLAASATALAVLVMFMK